MKYYAIASKSWVEIREAEDAPQAVKSTSTTVKDSVRRTIKTTLFQGGTVLAMIPTRQFSATTGMRIYPGTCERLNKDFLKPLLKFDWKHQDVEMDQPGIDGPVST